MTHRARLAVAAVVLLVFGTLLASVCVHRETAPEGAPTPTVLKHVDGSLTLTFHVPTCDYSLFDTTSDPKMLKNLRETRPDDFRRLKEEFRERVKKEYDGVEPEDLRNRPEMVDRLRGHPYF